MLLNNHSEVFNNYILEAREMFFLSMIETIFCKILQRTETKQREARKWTERICPKIKKKMDKFLEWSKQCDVTPAGNYLYSVSSHEFVKDYYVNFLTLVEIGVLAPVGNPHLHRFCNQCKASGTKASSFSTGCAVNRC
jgi:hypothetical protein